MTMKYERRYSIWKEEAAKVSFTLVLRTAGGADVGSTPVELAKPYSRGQLQAAIRAAVRTIEGSTEGGGEELLRRVLAIENEG